MHLPCLGKLHPNSMNSHVNDDTCSKEVGYLYKSSHLEQNIQIKKDQAERKSDIESLLK